MKYRSFKDMEVWKLCLPTGRKSMEVAEDIYFKLNLNLNLKLNFILDLN